MARPGTVVSLLDTPNTVSVPTDTGTAFLVGLTDRGPVTAPILVRSLDEFISRFGTRQSYSVLYDVVEMAFREGLNQAYIGRVVGPAATQGSIDLLNTYAGGGTASLTATAYGPGAWSANYKVAVVAGGAGGTFKIQIFDTTGAILLEDSGDLVDNNAGVTWGQTSQYVRVLLGPNAAVPAVHAATAMSAGTDDRASITDANWLTALNLFTPDLGPGQVAAPGGITSARWNQLADHAEANNRVGICDMPNIGTAATLEADAAAISSRFCAAYAPWVVIPGTTNTGPTRTVPPCALIIGLIGKNDATRGTNRPSAGNYGVSKYAIDLSQSAWDDLTRQAMNASGVNVLRRMFNGIRVYGWRTTTNAVSDANWIDFANSRLFMQISAELDEIGENFMFEEIDGQNGSTIGAFHGGLAGVCKQHFDNKELFGDTSDEAYLVDTGPLVNTLATIADLQLNAVVSLKMAPFAEYIQIKINKRQVSEAV